MSDVLVVTNSFVFISHSHLDNKFCRELLRQVQPEFEGKDFFYSTRDVHIDDFVGRISRKIKESPIFIVIISPNSAASDWVEIETDLAVRHYVPNKAKRTIIPVMYQSLDGASDNKLNGFLDVFHTIDCTEAHREQGFSELIQAIKDAERKVDLGASSLPPSQSQVSAIPPLPAFVKLRDILRSLPDQDKGILLSQLGMLLPREGIRYKDLGFRSLSALMLDAEAGGYARVRWQGERTVVYAPIDEAEAQLIASQADIDSQGLEVPSKGVREIDEVQLLATLDYLDKSLPYITRQGLVKFVVRKDRSVSPDSVSTFVDRWIEEQKLVVYQTGPICTNETGTLVDAEAIRIEWNVDMRATLAAFYAQQESSWQNLPMEKRAVLVATFLILELDLPQFHWQRLANLLVKNDAAIDWNITFVSAVDADVIRTERAVISHSRTGNQFTLKRISIDESHPDIRAILKFGAPD